MNLELETWDIINSYFRDIPNYLSRHHIDSYNDFINNKIPLIFKNYATIAPYIIIDKDIKSGLVYEIQIYYGGKTHDKYTIKKPIITSYPSGKVRQLYPNEARLKNLTYAIDFFFDIDVEITVKKNDITIIDKMPHPNPEILRNIYLGKIPIMLKSDLCVLNGANDELLRIMGEDKYDLGGYFIIDGGEKVIVSQERKAENIIFLNTISSNTEKYTHVAEIKCVSDEAFSKARSVKIQLERIGGAITVCLGQKNKFLKEYNNRDVPLFIMFRALGIESDKEILEFIVGNLNTELAQKMMDLLRPSILDPYILDDDIYDKERAEAYLVKLPSRALSETKTGISDFVKNKVNQLSMLYSTLDENFFPHISAVAGDLNRAKAYYLGYITRKLLLLRMGLVKDTDRDNFINKRIDLSGFLIATLFRDSFFQTIYAARVAIESIYRFNTKEYSGIDKIAYIINETNITKIFDPEVFKKNFIGSLKKGTISQKVGVVQELDRVSRNNAIAHLRRIIDNVSGNVTTPRRRLHVSQYGCVCPVETPEGENVGLNKGLAIISHITFGSMARPIIDFLVKHNMELLNDLSPIELQPLTKIFVNGNWVGCHRDPQGITDLLRLYRRNGLINTFISITWEYSINEIYIYTDGGRFVRPLYIIEHNNILLQPRHLIEIQNGNMTFTDLISGFRPRTRDFNYYDGDIKPLSVINLEIHDELHLEKLRESQAVIEYLDNQEFDTIMLSKSFNIPYDSLQHFTHVELHPSMMLSFNAHLLPFADFNASARVIFSSKHVKQGISTYAMNFNNRIDTASQIINYPQLPLCQGRLHKAITQNKYGQGQNIFVALVNYNYNQEDAIIGNQSAIDMGLFHSSLYKQYYDFEIRDPQTGEESHFYNPLYKDEIPTYPDELVANGSLDYNIIDKYGFPKPGTVLTDDSVVISKYSKLKDDMGQDVFKDMSTTTKLGNAGAVVDRVFTWQTTAEGVRTVKVRVCKNNAAIMGDKFSSRNGQKGTFGITMPREDLPYTEDGIIPDFILDPVSYHKRMTVNQLIEILFGNLASELGFMGVTNIFETFNIEQINEVLESKLGLTSWGDRILYNGKTGEQINVKIFSGLIFYQRLKYLVNDKINYRICGKRDEKTGTPIPGGLYTIRERQSVSGRAAGGGLRIGEMERDALISHGIWGFIKESFIERCDKFIIHVSVKSGEIAIANPTDGIFYDNISDGIASYQLVEGSENKGITPDNIIGLNLYDQKTMDFIQVVVPYSFKLLIQEMEGMMLKLRFNVSNLRNIIVNTENGMMPELTTEMIDDLMDDINYFDNNELFDYEENNDTNEILDIGENVISGGGHADSTTSTTSNTSTTDTEAETDDDSISESGNSSNDDEKHNNSQIEISTGEMPNSTSTSQLTNSHLNSSRPQLTPSTQPSSTQPSTQPQESTVAFGGGGYNDIPIEEIDLDQYGGVKPDFEIKERDDEKVIENLNSQLFGIQKGGMDEIIEHAKTEGIKQTFESNLQPQQQPQFQQQHQPQQPQFQQQGGLNFNFNPGNSNTLNNNIKSVSIDTNIKNGYIYSESKNLDPFNNI